MKPTFSSLKNNIPDEGSVSRSQLFQEIGWDDLVDKSEYRNTCAIRMRLGLIKSGVQISGSMPIKKGEFSGSRIEPGQAKLAKFLEKPSLFGVPEKFSKDSVDAGLNQRKGLVVFWKIPGYMNGNGGHIDIISTARGVRFCGSGCYFNTENFWFWELG